MIFFENLFSMAPEKVGARWARKEAEWGSDVADDEGTCFIHNNHNGTHNDCKCNRGRRGVLSDSLNKSLSDLHVDRAVVGLVSVEDPRLL